MESMMKSVGAVYIGQQKCIVRPQVDWMMSSVRAAYIGKQNCILKPQVQRMRRGICMQGRSCKAGKQFLRWARMPKLHEDPWS